MGIQGLLPLLKSIMVPIHIKELEGCSVAIDAYSWLHKAALSCSVEICKGLPATRHIDYCMHRVNLLRHYGVEPVLVFDGDFLPMKGEQENKRARVRRENLARAIEHDANGNSAAAYECYQKAVDISPALAFELIQFLKRENVCYVVAPYEADAQMTFLAVSKQVHAVITEDSDLIPFGCPRIIFKMDKHGHGVEFQYSRLQQNKEISFVGFTMQMLLEMCILSGCDYLQSLPGMGLKRAHALIKKFKTYDKVIKHLRYSGLSVPSHYEELFKKAIWTFRHQRIYDPNTEDLIHLSDPSDDIGTDLDFLGPLLAQQVAQGIANGDLDPVTKKPFTKQEVNSQVVLPETYLLKSFRPEKERRTPDLPVQKNLLTNYFCFASLEAKRKFRAPRVADDHPKVMNGFSPSIEDHTTEKAGACKANDSPASLLDCGHLDSGPQSEESLCNVEDHTKYPENWSNTHHDAVDDKNSARALLQQSIQAVKDPYLESCNKNVHRTVSDAVDGKMRKEKRKVVVRSPYFQHMFVEDGADDKTETPLVENEAGTDFCENNFVENNPFESFMYGGVAAKRKTDASNNFRMGADKGKCARTNASYPSSGHCNPKSEDSFSEEKAEDENFGCNISHLPRYSDIAEKSMERFVSMISSFRYSSSGSRASGLRAPLKDVKNTTDVDRPTGKLDFSKFEYVARNPKGSRRG